MTDKLSILIIFQVGWLAFQPHHVQKGHLAVVGGWKLLVPYSSSQLIPHYNFWPALYCKSYFKALCLRLLKTR
jgi:hypothetical protein